MSRAWPVLHGLLWVGALALAAQRLTPGLGVAAAALGAALGAWLGGAAAATRLRTWTLAAGAGLLAAAGLLLGTLLDDWLWPSRLLGGRTVYLLSELLPAVLVPLALVGGLEALGRRARAWRLAGLALAAAAYAAPFAAHRDGFFNRPYFLADPLWGAGQDPLPWFLGLGLGLAALLAALLLGRDAGRRAVAGLGVLLAALAVLFVALPRRHLKQITELHRTQGPAGPGGPGDTQDPRSRGEAGGGTQPRTPKEGFGQDFQDQAEDDRDGAVAVVVFHNDYRPAHSWYYFREGAFSAFNGVRVVADGGRFDRDLPRPGQAPAPAPAGREVRTTVAVMAAHAQPFGLVAPASLAETGNPDPKRFFGAWEVRSRVPEEDLGVLLRTPPGDPAWDAGTERHYLEGPAESRYRDLAGTIVADLPEALRAKPFARALAIKLWMDKNCIYSLDTVHGGSPDPVGDFLFGDRRGHCVYLAHAACLLYRAAGVPARVGTGYAADPAFRRGGAALLLRASSAHAWPEVHLAGQGWLPLDIAPERSEAPAQEAPDEDLQRMLGALAEGDRPPPPPPPDQDPAPRRWLALLARGLGWAAGLLAALALPAALAVAGWRRWIPYLARPAAVPRLAYRAALDAAAAHGHRRAFGETREAFAARLAALSPAFADLTALHLRWALGARREPPPAAGCLRLLRACRADLRAGAAPLRRWLAPLHPLAWARVH